VIDPQEHGGGKDFHELALCACSSRVVRPGGSCRCGSWTGSGYPVQSSAGFGRGDELFTFPYSDADANSHDFTFAERHTDANSNANSNANGDPD
jgi:hypothetical protein